MKDVTAKNFGFLIAYVLPGLVALGGASFFSDTIRGWLQGSGGSDPTVGGFLYITLASIGVGMTVSAVRWVVVDTIHHNTGLNRPEWDDSNLAQNLEAYENLIEIHYRYYQFHANMLIAVVFAYPIWRASGTRDLSTWSDISVLFLICVFAAVSRDNLRKYYNRVTLLLGTPEREASHE